MDGKLFESAEKMDLIKFCNFKKIEIDDIYAPKWEIIKNKLLFNKIKYKEFKTFMYMSNQKNLNLGGAVINTLNSTHINQIDGNTCKYDIRNCKSLPIVVDLLVKYQKDKHRIFDDSEYIKIWNHYQHLYEKHILQLDDKINNFHYVYEQIRKVCSCNIKKDKKDKYCTAYKRFFKIQQPQQQQQQPQQHVQREARAITLRMDGIHIYLLHSYDMQLEKNPDKKDDGDKQTPAAALDYPFNKQKFIFTTPYLDPSKSPPKSKLHPSVVQSLSALVLTSLTSLKKYLLQNKQPHDDVFQFYDYIIENECDTDTIKWIITDDDGDGMIPINLFNSDIKDLLTDFYEQEAPWPAWKPHFDYINYEYGYRFYYWEYYRDRNDGPVDIGGTVFNPLNDETYRHRYHDLFVDAKYSNLKNEMLAWGKRYGDLDYYPNWLWEDHHTTSQQYMKYDDVRKTTASGALCSNYNILTGSSLPLQNINAIVIYTHCSTYPTEFSKSFRKLSKDEDTKDLIKRNEEFAVVGRLLRELVEIFGEVPEKTGIFLRGIQEISIFTGFIPYLNAPTSTTTAPTIATQFSDSVGVIIELKRYDNNIRCFDCKYVSCFPSEKEVFFFGGNSRVILSNITIYVPESKQFRAQCSALGVINRTVCAVDLPRIPKKRYSKDVHNYVAQILTQKYTAGNHRYPFYLIDVIEHFLQNQKVIKLNPLDLVILNNKMKMFQLDCSLVNVINDVPFVQYAKLNELFPNTITINCDYSIMFRDGMSMDMLKPTFPDLMSQIEAISKLNNSRIRKIRLLFPSDERDIVHEEMRLIESNLNQLNFLFKPDVNGAGVTIERHIFD